MVHRGLIGAAPDILLYLRWSVPAALTYRNKYDDPACVENEALLSRVTFARLSSLNLFIALPSRNHNKPLLHLQP
jgi:hypothetical protein